jgi:hypothetical protein
LTNLRFKRSMEYFTTEGFGATITSAFKGSGLAP